MNTTTTIFQTRLRAFVPGLAVSVLLAFLHMPVYGSTLWGAAGSRVDGGGILVGKNYDAVSGSCELRMVIPRQGFSYFGLFPVPGRKGQGPMAGVNEKGLAIVTASPDSLAPPARGKPPGELIMEQLLTGFDTVDGLLSAEKILEDGPSLFYVVADRSKIALVETAPRGARAVRTIDKGVLFHTNHYIDEALLPSNKRPHKNSQMRFDHIGLVLNGLPGPLTMDDFIRISEDKGAQPGESIIRPPGPPGATRTLATWILFLPKSGPPELHALFLGPEEVMKEYDSRLDQSFWTEGLE